MSPLEEPLPEGLVDALGTAAAYPLDPDAESGIEHIQTHLSHVFLLARHVYKLHKAVDLGFVDFSTRAARNADCVNEVGLNRRLAPSVYLGVAPIEASTAGLRVGETMAGPDRLDDGREHCVVMERLEADRDALSLLERGVLDESHLEAVAHKMARFHATLSPIETEGAGDVAAPAEANLHAIESAGGDVVSARDTAMLRAATASALAALAPAFERRRREGRVVDGHGDLHLQHVWLPTDASGAADPPIIDCLEFSESLRVIDVAAEVAFLAMDLVYRGAGDLAERFLRRYAEETGDFDLYSVVDFYVCHRAAVRAKVAALAAADTGIDSRQRAGAAESTQRHVDLALRALEPRAPGAIVLVGGVIGTGKSTVARMLADRLGAVVVSSDRVRKARLGLQPTDRLSSRPDDGAYAPDAREQVYVAMLACAAPIVASGRTVVLDATWSGRAMRERARAFASSSGSERCVFVETRCDPDVLRVRLADRATRNDDPSDAGPELLDASLRGFEALDEVDPWPVDARTVIDTDRTDLDARIATLPAELGLTAGSPWD